jgi:hypothetical protein
MDGMKATGLRHVHLAANALLRAQLLTNKPGKGAWPVSTVPEHSARSITSFMPGEHGFLLMLARSAEFNPCIWFRALTHKKRYIDDEVDPIKHSLHRREEVRVRMHTKARFLRIRIAKRSSSFKMPKGKLPQQAKPPTFRWWPIVARNNT